MLIQRKIINGKKIFKIYKYDKGPAYRKNALSNSTLKIILLENSLTTKWYTHGKEACEDMFNIITCQGKAN